ncbi:unnamed protein product [Rotaria socialis]|uniref:Uncharacterized protein n=1 Tax=Rotaria socialis TaxID=392032 RepID=A0A820T4I1_9BILA|nr:unnamed protein product [Rotaria socialis]CAF4466269.1 unnamed protein product [Rotaria socialis]
MLSEEDSLRPYPIDAKQDEVVRKILRVKAYGPISGIILFFSNISQRITFCLNDYVKERTRNRPIERKDANEIITPCVCKSTDAMDSKYFYAVREGRIWFKPIAAHENARWNLLANNGYTNKKKTPLISVSADGDNIIAVDQNQTIHYGKTNKVICQVSFIRPQWRILRSTVNWRENWFGMEGVSLLVNLFKNPILRSIPNARSIAISHKGPDTMYYTDMNGKKHPDPYVGVTSIYMLNDDGTRIFFADPWLHNKFENELTGPEDGRFKAETLAASASTIMVIQRARNEFGQEINKVYTRFADFDSIGSNPALKATYNRKNRLAMIRYIPSEDWIQQPSITLSGKARLTKNIALLQIGWGQNNRQLRVQGQDTDGRNGYYHKNIYDAIWTFEATDNILIDEEEFLSDSIPYSGFEQGPKITEDYKNGILRPHNIKNLLDITLENFSRRGLNERGLHTKLVLTLENDVRLSLPLYARRGWKSLIGISGENIWKLIIPDEYYNDDNVLIREVLQRIFRNKRRCPVNVYERAEEIRIANVFGNCHKFEFIFRNKQI